MKMRTLCLIPVLAILTSTISCQKEPESQAFSSEAFDSIEKVIKRKFGDNAYYTDIAVTYDKSIGNIINVTVTKDPSSLQMGTWIYSQETWTQNSEIMVEVPEGSQASDFMFQLNDQINLRTLGEMIEKSSSKLTTNRGINNPKLNLAFIKFPDNGDMSKAGYTVMLKPENGGTSFTFDYSLNGDLIKMNY